jgi:protein required for attachment to host cells
VFVLVADGARARLFRYRTGRLEPASNAELVGSHLRTRDIDADKPGRSFDSTGSHRHALTPASDAHRNAERAFVREVAQWLDEALAREKFDHLILVAPPRALGDLRHAMSKETAARVIGTVKKELTTSSAAEVLAHLDAALFR